MAHYRLPGPTCSESQTHIVADGTTNLWAPCPPGPIDGAIPTMVSEYDPRLLAWRTKDLLRACERAVALVPGAVYNETRCQLGELMRGLAPALLTAAAVMGASVALGGIVGAGLGAFAAGFGAAPGAIAGAAVGTDIGVMLINWLGLGLIALAIGRGTTELGMRVSRAVRTAWNAHGHPDSAHEIDYAANTLASAVPLLIKLILMASRLSPMRTR